MSSGKKRPDKKLSSVAPKEYDGHGRITGPCGDTMEFWIVVSKERIHEASFTTTGCGSSAACGNMTAELAKGRTLQEASALQQKDILEALGGMPPESEHCALLSVNTLKAAIEDYSGLRRGGSQTNIKNEKKGG